MPRRFALALALAFLAAPALAQPVTGTFALEEIKDGEQRISMETLMGQMRQTADTATSEVLGLRIAWVLEEHSLTNHLEFLIEDQDMGFLACVAELTLPIQWSGDELQVPVPGKASSLFRPVGGDAAEDRDLSCSTSLPSTTFKVVTAGDSLLLRDSTTGDLMTFRKAESRYMDYSTYLPE